MNKYQEDIKYALYHYYNGNEDKVNEALIATGIKPPTSNMAALGYHYGSLVGVLWGLADFQETELSMELTDTEDTEEYLSDYCRAAVDEAISMWKAEKENENGK